MRLAQIIFVAVALALTVLPSFSAMARNSIHIELRYQGCYCYFGYLGREDKSECVPAASCASEGGRGYFTAVEIDPNVVLRLVPTPFTAAMIATAMPDAMRPYSMAVAPESSFRNAANFRRIIQT
jgi:hypothetical protein